MNRNYIVLSEKETASIRERIEGELYKTLRSGWSPYWYPLNDIKKDIAVIAFDSDFWNDDNNMQLLFKIMRDHNIKKVYTLQECSNVYVYDDFLSEVGIFEEDEDGYNFPYYSEQYVWDKSHDWLIYTSHEATVTFAGEWLVKSIKEEVLKDNIYDIEINNKIGCPDCGQVTWHIIHMKKIIYKCPNCGKLFYLK